MQDTQRKQRSNQSMECCKLIAVIFVVFVHVPFPGTLGGIVTALARFAVPSFFAISGYFSFRTDDKKITKRILRITKLNLLACLLYLLWGLYRARYVDGGSRMVYLREIFSTYSLSRGLLFNTNFINDPLWYLSAITYCYGALWLYVRFFRGKPVDYRPLYGAGFCLLVLHFCLGEFAMAHWVELPYQFYRNALFMGMPMFVLGMFVREYQEELIPAYGLTNRRLCIFFLAGMALSLLEWRGIGNCEMFVGSVIATTALMLLMAKNPKLPICSKAAERGIASFGALSTWIYILHISFLYLYDYFLRDHVSPVLGGKEGYFRTLAVTAVSVLAAVLCEWIKRKLKQLNKKTA